MHLVVWESRVHRCFYRGMVYVVLGVTISLPIFPTFHYLLLMLAASPTLAPFE